MLSVIGAPRLEAVYLMYSVVFSYLQAHQYLPRTAQRGFSGLQSTRLSRASRVPTWSVLHDLPTFLRLFVLCYDVIGGFFSLPGLFYSNNTPTHTMHPFSDALHEDINRVKNKPYIPECDDNCRCAKMLVDSFANICMYLCTIYMSFNFYPLTHGLIRPLAIRAAEAWENYLARNCSKVADMFAVRIIIELTGADQGCMYVTIIYLYIYSRVHA